MPAEWATGEWWEDHDNLILTSRWMADNGYDASDLAYFIEKPWKYEDEYISAKVVNELER